jgi:prepilin-type N-terminal cleavage/methylation domain-containing protein
MKHRGEGGFTLIETIVGLTVMAIMVSAVGQIFVSNLQTLTLSKARAIALAAANEQIEYLRDLPYDSVKTLGGAIYPPGIIPDTQTIVRGGYTFSMKTQVDYVDDPYDGNAAGTIVGKPKDLNPADYKKAQVTLYMKSGEMVAQLTTDIAGKAAETASNTGIISVLVVDANGTPVPNATVTITNPTPSPAVNITTTTDNQGMVVIPNLPPDSSNRYQVIASLSGYSTDGTLTDPPGAQTAVQQNLNVIIQNTQAVTLKIDLVATLNLHVTNTAGVALSGKSITINSSKLIYQTPNVSKYSQASTTDASGNISLTGMEWDSYSFAPPAGYYLVSSQPYMPASLLPSTGLTVNLVLSSSSSYPTISLVTPTSAQSGTTSTTMVLTGTNLISGTSVILRRSGYSDINISGETSSNGNKTLTGTLNLTGAAAGAWDIVVTAGSSTVTQVGGLNVSP